MRYFKRSLLYGTDEDKRKAKTFDQVHHAYLQHLKVIRPKLSEAAWTLAGLTFHDAKVLSVAQPSRRELLISLEGGYSGCGYDFMNDKLLNGRFTSLSFLGVKKFWVPQTIVGDYWLYEEMTLSDIAMFDYQVLLAKDEIRIQADEVEIRTHD